MGKYLQSATASSEADAYFACSEGKTNFAPGATSSSSCVLDAHVLDFHGCTDGTPVVDGAPGSALAATAKNGPSCSAEGMAFDRVDDWVDLDGWKWGGTMSIDVYVKCGTFNSYSCVFDFGNGASSNSVMLYNQGTKSIIEWDVRLGSTYKDLTTSNFDSFTWNHMVVKASGTTMKVYKNGALVGTKRDGHEPKVLTRTQNYFGRSIASWDDYFDGTISYMKIYPNKELTDTENAALEHSPQTPALMRARRAQLARTSPTPPALTPSLHDNPLDCVVCSAGTYLADDATDPALQRTPPFAVLHPSA